MVETIVPIAESMSMHEVEAHKNVLKKCACESRCAKFNFTEVGAGIVNRAFMSRNSSTEPSNDERAIVCKRDTALSEDGIANYALSEYFSVSTSVV